MSGLVTFINSAEFTFLALRVDFTFDPFYRGKVIHVARGFRSNGIYV